MRGGWVEEWMGEGWMGGGVDGWRSEFTNQFQKTRSLMNDSKS